MVTLTVYFDDPWWVGVVECQDDQVLRVFRFVFGSEPSNEEVFTFVLRSFVPLTSQMIAGIAGAALASRRVSPKRAAREAARRVQERGVSTRSQEALRVAQEAQKCERRVRDRAEEERQAVDKRQKVRAKALARRRGH